MTPTGLDYLQDYRDGVDLQDYFIDRVINGGDTAPRLAAFVPTADAEVRRSGAGYHSPSFNHYRLAGRPGAELCLLTQQCRSL
jgi:hypothetical protein